jgi:RNA polymerase sigma factor (sigma-70 family)
MSHEPTLHNPVHDSAGESFDALVRQAQQASPDERREILDQLINQFAEAAFRWAVMVLEDTNAASDALQDAWLNAYLHLDQLREGTAFPAWLRQIVLSTCYHAIRHEKRDRTLMDDPSEELPSTSDPVHEVEQQERLDHIREAILALPERERVVTKLYYFDGYPQQEIAEVLAVPVTTVKKRLQYARERLKGLIHTDIVSRHSYVAIGDATLDLTVDIDDFAFNGGCTAAAFGYPAHIATVATEIEWSSVSQFV